MTSQTRAKQERVIEAVRQGLEGDAAVEFVQKSGFAMSNSGIARHLRLMGGRQRIQDFIDEGASNYDILTTLFPGEAPENIPTPPPLQCELFETPSPPPGAFGVISGDIPLYETTKLTITIPTELFEAIRIASKIERKSRTDLIVEILTAALSQVPNPPETEDEPA